MFTIGARQALFAKVENMIDALTEYWTFKSTLRVLQCRTWNSAQCYVATWMGEEFWGECVSPSVLSNSMQPH